MVGIGRVAQNPLVLFVEGVHRVPGEGDAIGEDTRVPGEARVLPGASRGLAVAGLDGIPGRGSEVGMIRRPVSGGEDVLRDVAFGEVGDGIAARLVQEDDVIALGDPGAAEPHPHPPAQRLGVQQPRRERLGDEEGADRSRGQRSLLPRESHLSRLSSCVDLPLPAVSPARIEYPPPGRSYRRAAGRR